MSLTGALVKYFAVIRPGEMMQDIGLGPITSGSGRPISGRGRCGRGFVSLVAAERICFDHRTRIEPLSNLQPPPATRRGPLITTTS